MSKIESPEFHITGLDKPRALYAEVGRDPTRDNENLNPNQPYLH